jgi:hypothetical protein
MLNGFRQSRFHLERCQGEGQPIFFCKSPVGPLLDLSADALLCERVHTFRLPTAKISFSSRH